MSERKVLNKYYPPDFDPSKIPRLRLPKERQYTVRLMAPCNMKCTTCGEYIYKGKKFNARKETVQNEEYLGIKIFRFYIKCPRCLAEVTFKTDPENADYIVEHGATRNFQALKLAEEAAEKEVKEKEEEEKNNPMTLLENRTKASKNEMESLEALEEIRELNQRHAKVDFEQLLHQNHLKLLEKQKKQEEEDEAFIKSVFYTVDGERVKRIANEPTSAVTSTFYGDMGSGSLKRKQPDQGSSSHQRSMDALKKAVKVKKSSPPTVPDAAGATASTTAPSVSITDGNKQPNLNSAPTGLNLLSAYSDSDSED